MSRRWRLLQKAPLPLSPAAGAPRAGCRPAPRVLGCERAGEGGAEPVRGEQQPGPRSPSFLRVRLLPGRNRVPGVSRVSPFSARIGLGGCFPAVPSAAGAGPSSGGLSRYGAIICWLQLFSRLVTGPVWAAGHVLESPRVPGAIGAWGRWLCLSLHRVNSSRPGSCAAAPPVPARGAGAGTTGPSHRVPWPLPGAGAVPPSRFGGDNAVGPVGPAVLCCTL